MDRPFHRVSFVVKDQNDGVLFIPQHRAKLLYGELRRAIPRQHNHAPVRAGGLRAKRCGQEKIEMARQEVKEIGWILKWAAILGFIGAIIGPIIFIQDYIDWQIASPSYYLNFFRELFNNPQYKNGLTSFYLSAALGAIVGAFAPLVFLFKK